MKKKLGVTIGTVVGATVLGLGIYHSSASQVTPDLSTDEVRSLVADQYPGEITELELEKNAKKAIYEVEILDKEKDKEYELTLDGNTGEVIHLKEGKALDDDSDDDENEDEAEAEDNGDDDVANDTQNKKSVKKAAIDAKEAEEIALKEFNGQVKTVEKDEDDGRLIWEVEVRSDKKEAEFEIDAYTGEIIVMSIDEDTEDDNDND